VSDHFQNFWGFKEAKVPTSLQRRRNVTSLVLRGSYDHYRHLFHSDNILSSKMANRSFELEELGEHYVSL
jgi:hypothetical protein